LILFLCMFILNMNHDRSWNLAERYKKKAP
jgi:hypothetical protein